jgi:hypothetical protein
MYRITPADHKSTANPSKFDLLAKISGLLNPMLKICQHNMSPLLPLKPVDFISDQNKLQ